MAEMFQEDPAMLELFGPEFAARDKAQQMSAVERDLLVKSFGDVFETEAGKRVFWWLLTQCHLYQTSFTGNSLTYFKEGERNIGLKALGLMLEAKPMGLHDLVEFKRKENET